MMSNNEPLNNERRSVPKQLEVIGSEYITPHMLRVTLSGEAFTAFSTDREGGYIKVILFSANSSNPNI